MRFNSLNIKILNIKYLLFFVLFTFAFLLFTLIPVSAAEPAQLAYDPSEIEPLTSPLGEEATVPSVVGSTIKYGLSIVGSVALVIFIYGGVRWMTARGNAEQSKSAAQVMLWAALGVAMIFGSYLVLDLVFKAAAK